MDAGISLSANKWKILLVLALPRLATPEYSILMRVFLSSNKPVHFFFDGNGRCTAHALRKKNNTEFGYTEPTEAWLTDVTGTNSLLQNRGQT
jgi:hypothetical protein